MVAALIAELLDDQLDVLLALGGGDQNRVADAHDDETLDPQEGDDALTAIVDDTVLGVEGDRFAQGHVAGIVDRSVAGQRTEGPDVVPFETGTDRDHAARSLHDAAVDADARGDGLVRPVDGLCAEGAVELGAGRAHRRPESRLLTLEFGGDGVRAPDEDAAVPIVAPAVHESLRAVSGRLLVKTRHFEETVGALDAPFEVAVAKVRDRRRDAKGHQDGFGFGGLEGTFEIGGKSLVGGDEVVGGEHAHRGLGASLLNQGRREGDAGGGVFAAGLTEDVPGVSTGLFDQGRRLALVGDVDDVITIDPGRDARLRVLDERASGTHFEQLLRTIRAAAGPETGPRASGHDDCKTLVH